MPCPFRDETVCGLGVSGPEWCAVRLGRLRASWGGAVTPSVDFLTMLRITQALAKDGVRAEAAGGDQKT